MSVTSVVEFGFHSCPSLELVCVGSFTSPGIDTTPAFNVSSERHRQCEVNKIA